MYTMACPPVRGDNPRVLASGLSYVQVDKLYTTYISVDLAHHEIFRAKVGKGGTICVSKCFSCLSRIHVGRLTMLGPGLTRVSSNYY